MGVAQPFDCGAGVRLIHRNPRTPTAVRGGEPRRGPPSPTGEGKKSRSGLTDRLLVLLLFVKLAHVAELLILILSLLFRGGEELFGALGERSDK